MRDLRFRKYYLAALLSGMTFAVYLPALRNGFVNYDDDLYVYNNPDIRSLGWPFLRWAFTSFHAGNWHPLTWISHALDYAVWGLNPLGHHLTNVVLHGVNTFLVVLLVQGLLDAWRERSAAAGTPSFLDERGALIAAGTTGVLFGLHPVHVESVAWVAERKDLLCGLFFLLSVLSYLRFAGAAEKEGADEGGAARFLRRGYLSSLSLFVLALMSKPMAVSLPLVLLLLDWHPLRRIRSRASFRSALIEKLPFIVLTLLSAIVTVLAQREALWTVAPPMAIRLLVASKALISYLSMMAAPVHLLPLYPYARSVSYYLTLEYAIAVVLVLAVTILSIRAIRRERLWFAVWSYYIVTLLPVLGIVQVGSQSMADRYTYLPSIGPFLLAGLGAAWVRSKTGASDRRGPSLRLVTAGAAMLLIIALSLATLRQTGIWRSSLDLWSRVIERDPERVPTAYYNRGLAFRETGQPDLALSDLGRAIALRPAYLEARMSRGMMYMERGLIEQAIEDFNAAIAAKPTHASAYLRRGLALTELGWVNEALEDYTTAIALSPYTPGAYVQRGMLYRVMGQAGRAIDDMNAALSLDPDNVPAYIGRGDLYRESGDAERAAMDYRSACERGSTDGCAALRGSGRS